jgi:hypothetical protein
LDLTCHDKIDLDDIGAQQPLPSAKKELASHLEEGQNLTTYAVYKWQQILRANRPTTITPSLASQLGRKSFTENHVNNINYSPV